MLPHPSMEELLRHWHSTVDHGFVPPWQRMAIAGAIVAAAVWMESSSYRQRRRWMPGFRGGVVVGLAASSLAASTAGWLCWHALCSGAIKCAVRHCRGSDFVDRLGQRHLEYERYVSMSFDAPLFWMSFAALASLVVMALFVLVGCLRAAAHWRELD
jgi:hypothetical protein